MAVVLLTGHVSRALDFFRKTDVFFGLGQPDPWPDENNPPIPSNVDQLINPIGYKRINSKYLVVPDDVNGELSYRNHKWKIVTEGDALTMGARWVYLYAEMDYTDFPVDISYRQIAVNTGLVVADGVPEGTNNLLPNQVADVGIPEVLDNRTPIYREFDQKERLIFVIEF